MDKLSSHMPFCGCIPYNRLYYEVYSFSCYASRSLVLLLLLWSTFGNNSSSLAVFNGFILILLAASAPRVECWNGMWYDGELHWILKYLQNYLKPNIKLCASLDQVRKRTTAATNSKSWKDVGGGGSGGGGGVRTRLFRWHPSPVGENSPEKSQNWIAV